MNNYGELALADLSALGFTVEGLIARYPLELMRFRLSCDLGETGIELPHARANEDPLVPAAKKWLELAAMWPPLDNIAGIDMPILESAFSFALKNKYWNLRQIPEALQTEELRICAVQNDNFALALIPACFQNEAVFLSAVRHHGYALAYIPVERQSESVRLAAVSKHGCSLKFIPAEHQSEAVRLAAVRQNAEALEYIPADQQSDAVKREVLKKTRYPAPKMTSLMAKKMLQKLRDNASEL